VIQTTPDELPYLILVADCSSFDSVVTYLTQDVIVGEVSDSGVEGYLCLCE